MRFIAFDLELSVGFINFQLIVLFAAAANAGLLGVPTILAPAPVADVLPAGARGLKTLPNGATVPIEPPANQLAKAQHLAIKAAQTPILAAPYGIAAPLAAAPLAATPLAGLGGLPLAGLGGIPIAANAW